MVNQIDSSFVNYFDSFELYTVVIFICFFHLNQVSYLSYKSWNKIENYRNKSFTVAIKTDM